MLVPNKIFVNPSLALAAKGAGSVEAEGASSRSRRSAVTVRLGGWRKRFSPEQSGSGDDGGRAAKTRTRRLYSATARSSPTASSRMSPVKRIWDTRDRAMRRRGFAGRRAVLGRRIEARADRWSALIPPSHLSGRGNPRRLPIRDEWPRFRCRIVPPYSVVARRHPGILGLMDYPEKSIQIMTSNSGAI